MYVLAGVCWRVCVGSCVLAKEEGGVGVGVCVAAITLKTCGYS